MSATTHDDAHGHHDHKPSSLFAGCAAPTTGHRHALSVLRGVRRRGRRHPVGDHARSQRPGQHNRHHGQVWNTIVTSHGLLMIFFSVMPGTFGGFGNEGFVPLMIGARTWRLAFEQHQLLVAAAGISADHRPVPGRVGTGWTLYPPPRTAPTSRASVRLHAVRVAPGRHQLAARRHQLHHHHLNMRARDDTAQDAAVRVGAN